MADETTREERAEEAAGTAEVELDDEVLDAVAGGQNVNSTQIVFASTFVPFDSSF